MGEQSRATCEYCAAAPELHDAIAPIYRRAAAEKRRPGEGVTVYLTPDDMDRLEAALTKAAANPDMEG